MIQQLVQTMRGPKAGTGTSSPKRSTFISLVVAEIANDPERAHALRPHVNTGLPLARAKAQEIMARVVPSLSLRRLDVGVADHLAPLGDLRLDVGVEFLRRVGRRRHAEGGEAVL